MPIHEIKHFCAKKKKRIGSFSNIRATLHILLQENDMISQLFLNYLKKTSIIHQYLSPSNSISHGSIVDNLLA